MHKGIRNLAALVAISSASAVVYAQTDSAQLSGVVTDATGAVVPGAVVKIHNDANGFDRTAKTNSSGVYSFQALPIGTYKEVVSFTGFGTYSTSITLNVGANATVDAKLGATATSTVEVTSGDEGTQVNLSTAETSTIVTSKQMVDLPSLTRNPYDFVVLSGAVNSDPNGSTARGVGASLNGQRSSGTEVLLDGVENADSYDATVGQTIPLDSVQEYRIIVNGFDAQYGRASGGIVNLATKSGTNAFHGSLYEFNRVSALASNTYNEDAQNFAQRAAGLGNGPRDHFTQNQFGYSIGGRILRDKLFFFNNYEWNRVRSSGQQIYEIPSTAYLATASAATKAFFAQYGVLAPGVRQGATVPVSGFAVNPLQIVTLTAPINAGAGDPINAYFGLSRIDYNLSNKVSMYFRAGTYSDAYFPGHISLSPYAGFATGQNDKQESFLYNINYIITPNLLSSSKVSYSRINISQPLSSAGIAPSLYLNQANVASTDGTTGNVVALPGYLPASPGGAIPFGGPQNTYQFLEDLSYTRGKHTVKAGGQFLQIRDNRTFGAYENAVEVAAKSGTALGTALSTLSAGNVYSFQVALNPQGKLPCSYPVGATTALGYTTTANCSITLPATSPNFERQNTFNDGNAYLEDQWKFTSRLTLNAGVRWEYYGVQHNHNPNLESNFFLGAGNNLPAQIQSGQVATTPNSPVGGLVKKNLTNFAPRVGFAYDIFGDGKWAIRGGYGISYERNFGNVTYNVIQNPPNYAGVTLASPTATPAIPLTNSNFGPFGAASGTIGLAPPSLRALQQNMPTAYTHQYNLTLEHEISRNDLISIYYTGARGIHLYSIANVNGIGYGNFVGYTLQAGKLPYYLDRINPQYGAINIREANGDSYYNALNTAIKINNLSHYGLQLTVNYTFAHQMDNLSSTFSESGNNFNLGYLNPFNPALDRGNADGDTRHRVVIGGIYQPSFLEFKSSKILHTVAGGLEFAPIATLRSGTPFTIFDCTNGENGCPRVVAAPGLAFHGTPKNNGGINSFDYINLPAAAANPFTNNLGFSDFPSTFGGYQNPGLERNQWFGPGNVQFDMGVYKNFAVGNLDRYKIQVRGEFYNILNHHNFYPIVGSADIAEVNNVGVVKGSPGGNPGPGDERRNVQLAVRLEF